MVEAEKDDLVTTDSALAVSNLFLARKKSTINPGGHVALCMSDTQQKIYQLHSDLCLFISLIAYRR